MFLSISIYDLVVFMSSQSHWQGEESLDQRHHGGEEESERHREYRGHGQGGGDHRQGRHRPQQQHRQPGHTGSGTIQWAVTWDYVTCDLYFVVAMTIVARTADVTLRAGLEPLKTPL